MKRFILLVTVLALAAATVWGLMTVDMNSKSVAGFLDGNTVFSLDREADTVFITVLNEKFSLRWK